MFQTRRRRNYDVRLQDGTAFIADPGETLLEAALRSGLRAPHNCRVGACGTCRCRLVRGKVKSLIDRAYVLQPHEIKNEVFFACQTLPVSDLVVDWEMKRDAEADHSANIVGSRQLTPRVWRVSISVDAELNALPGQYVRVTIEPARGQSLVRQFSLVTVTVMQGRTALDIDVTRRTRGRVSNWLTRDGGVGSGIRIEGPFGNCVAQEDLGPLIAIGAGSGIGAAMGVLIHSHKHLPKRPTALLAYGGQTHDIYGLEEVADSAREAGVRHFCRAWVEEQTTLVPNISSGRAPIGLATALAEATAMSCVGGDVDRDCQVLLYGPPGFVDCSIDSLVRSGMSAERIRNDRYQPYDATPSPALAEQFIGG